MDQIGFWAGIALPLFDIPLIARIIKRKSAADISVTWILGLWGCSVLMTPAAFISGERNAIAFNVANIVMLTAVLVAVIKYRKGTA